MQGKRDLEGWPDLADCHRLLHGAGQHAGPPLHLRQHVQGEVPPASGNLGGPENTDLTSRFLGKLRGNCGKERPEEWEVYASDAKDQVVLKAGICWSMHHNLHFYTVTINSWLYI